jgi:hypothetical protein
MTSAKLRLPTTGLASPGDAAAQAAAEGGLSRSAPARSRTAAVGPGNRWLVDAGGADIACLQAGGAAGLLLGGMRLTVPSELRHPGLIPVPSSLYSRPVLVFRVLGVLLVSEIGVVLHIEFCEAFSLHLLRSNPHSARSALAAPPHRPNSRFPCMGLCQGGVSTGDRAAHPFPSLVSLFDLKPVS